jgi:hypothetical protein
MNSDPIKTRAVGNVQIFDLVPESPAEQDRLSKLLHRENPSRAHPKWLATAAIGIMALLLGGVLGFIGRRPGITPPQISSAELLMASLTPQAGATRAAGPQEQVQFDTHLIYQIGRDFDAVLRSPREGFATIIVLAPDQAPVVYPGTDEERISIKAFKPYVYPDLPRPRKQSAIALIVTESPASSEIRKILETSGATGKVDRFLAHLQKELETAGYKWIAVDSITVEPSKKN